jgi:hypothetical protein
MIPETNEAMIASPLLVEETSARAPPYFRFLLSSKSLPPYLPAAMETHVPIETWAAFWFRIAPIVRIVELRETIYRAALLVLVAVWFGVIFYLPTVVDSVFVVYLSAILIVVPFVAVFTFGGRVKQSQLETVRTFCRDEEERAFRSHGFGMECDYEFGNNGGCDLYKVHQSGAVGIAFRCQPFRRTNTYQADSSRSHKTNGLSFGQNWSTYPESVYLRCA